MALCSIPTVGCESLFVGPPEYASVSVLATDSAGVGIPGAWLQLYTGVRVVAYGTTDENGRYLFTDVAPGGYGVLLISPPRYADPTESPATYKDGLDVAARTSKPVRFTLTECHGVIDATVTDQSGAGAEGVNVLFYSSTGPLETRATDSLGAASMDVPCGAYGVMFEPTLGYAVPVGRNSSFVDGLVIHRRGRERVALRVESCFGSLRVSVLDAANAPVPGATLVAYVPTHNIASGITGPDGRFTFARVPCGTDVGIAVGAPSGSSYRVVQGRGTSFVDGLRMANNLTTDVTFHLAGP